MFMHTQLHILQIRLKVLVALPWNGRLDWRMQRMQGWVYDLMARCHRRRQGRGERSLLAGFGIRGGIGLRVCWPRWRLRQRGQEQRWQLRVFRRATLKCIFFLSILVLLLFRASNYMLWSLDLEKRHAPVWQCHLELLEQKHPTFCLLSEQELDFSYRETFHCSSCGQTLNLWIRLLLSGHPQLLEVCLSLKLSDHFVPWEVIFIGAGKPLNRSYN